MKILLKMSENKFNRSKIELQIDQKCQIIEYYQKNPHFKQTDLIKYFNKLFNVIIPPTTISGILSASTRNNIFGVDNMEAYNKRNRESKYPDLERMLYLWNTMVIQKGVSASDAILIEKAKEFGNMLGITEGYSFKYSFGW